MARLGPVDFEDRLTLVEHLDELRTRIVISIVAFSVAFGLCFWQNSRLLDIANGPLPGDKTPITFGVAEPFTTTVTISAYAAIVIALPAATKFLLNFNDNQFNIQIRARDYYSFFTLTLGVMGLIFQLPIGILAVTRLGIVTPEQLSENRRYAYVILLIVAALLPGTDPVTMLIEAVPLILLYEGSVILARMFGRPPEPAA